MRHLLKTVLIFISLSSLAQNKIDSLKWFLAAAEEDSNYVKTCNDLFDAYISLKPSNYKSLALNIFKLSEKTALTINDTKGLAKAYFSVALLYDSQKMQDSLLYYLFKSEKYYALENNNEAIREIHFKIVRIYFYLNNPIEANKYVNYLLNNPAAQTKKHLVSIYMFKAVIFQNIADSMPKADKFFKEAIAIALTGHKEHLGILYNNYGQYL